MIDWLWQNSQQLGDLGQILTALIAGVGLGFAWGQITSARRVQTEATAKELWRGYEKACFEHPEFANPELLAVDYDKKTIDGDRLRFEKYDWFVSLFLNASEEIFYMTNRRDWRHTLRYSVQAHRGFLLSPYMSDAKDFYRREFISFVQKCLNKR